MSGNTASCSFDITVTDDENPTITCPANIVTCDTNVTVPLPQGNDNCSVASITNDYNNTGDASDIYPLGITTVTWTITDANGNDTNCVMTVEVSTNPTVAEAGDDQSLIMENTTTFNAEVPLVGSGEWSIVSGYGTIADDADPKSEVSGFDNGENVFRWTVSNGTCDETYDDVMITFQDIVIPSGFSPNGDFVNDELVITGIDQLENEIIIFNRWGVELYKTLNYKNDWKGISQNGTELPEDTYFYIIKLPEYDKEYSGYIVLKR